MHCSVLQATGPWTPDTTDEQQHHLMSTSLSGCRIVSENPSKNPPPPPAATWTGLDSSRLETMSASQCYRVAMTATIRTIHHKLSKRSVQR